MNEREAKSLTGTLFTLARANLIKEPWLPGMLMTCDGKPPVNPTYRLALMASDDGDEGGYAEYMGIPYADAFPSWGWPTEDSGWQPWPSDPATAGCLTALWRTAKKDAYAYPTKTVVNGYAMWDLPGHPHGFDTDIEAIIADLHLLAGRLAP